jgi:hypothetical protein
MMDESLVWVHRALTFESVEAEAKVELEKRAARRQRNRR